MARHGGDGSGGGGAGDTTGPDESNAHGTDQANTGPGTDPGTVGQDFEGAGFDGFQGFGFDTIGKASAAATADALGFGNFAPEDVSLGFSLDQFDPAVQGFGQELGGPTNPEAVQDFQDAIDFNNSFFTRAFNFISPIDIQKAPTPDKSAPETQISFDPFGFGATVVGGPLAGMITGALAPDVTIGLDSGQIGMTEGGLGSLGSLGGPGTANGAPGDIDGGFSVSDANDQGGDDGTFFTNTPQSVTIAPPALAPFVDPFNFAVLPPVATVPNIVFPEIPEAQLAAFQRRLNRFGA